MKHPPTLYEKTIKVSAVACIAVSLAFAVFAVHHQRRASGTAPPSNFIAVFSVDSASDLGKASSFGIGEVLNYGANYSGTDSYSQQVAANNMKIIDAMPWTYLRDYAQKSISQSQLITNLTNHLKAEQNNSLIVGYWVLDDWTYGDGTAKTLLQQMTSLIHQYTPGRPSICGFAGGLSSSGTGGSLDTNVADNFSPQGCDMVAPYIYADNGSHGTYDWGLTSVLPGIFSELASKGWDQTQTPLVGIPDAFGGGTWPTPDAAAVEAQAKAYCQNGAVGIIYYAFNESNGQDISDNTGIQQGVKAGSADCQNIWNAQKSATPPSVPTNLHATATTASSISLAWNASTDTGGPGLAGYKVYRAGSLLATTIPVSSGTSYTDSGLTANTSYGYTVSAYDSNNNESAQSPVVNISTSSASAVPGDCNADGHVTSIDLSLLLSHYGQVSSVCDFNADGSVNILDLSILLSNYGK
jgi:hypothetical protein